MEIEERIRDWQYAEAHPGFKGTLEFELKIEILGKSVMRPARAEYAYTPEWEYFDLHKNALHKCLGQTGLGIKLLTDPADDLGLTDQEETGLDEEEAGTEDEDEPSWVSAETFMQCGVLSREIWDAIDDAIDEKSKAEDAERRRSAGL